MLYFHILIRQYFDYDSKIFISKEIIILRIINKIKIIFAKVNIFKNIFISQLYTKVLLEFF